MPQEPTLQEAERAWKVEKLVSWIAVGLYTAIYLIASMIHPPLFSIPYYILCGQVLVWQVVTLLEAKHKLALARIHDEYRL